MLLLASPSAQAANNPTVTVTRDRDLAFGSFIVLGTGSKWVQASGAVINNGVIQVPGSLESPAQFTIDYKRSGGPNLPTNIVLQIAFGSMPPVSVGGVTGTISKLDVDLGGVTLVSPGGVITYTMTNCTKPHCTVSFHIGGRITVTNGTTGAVLIFPLAVSALVVSEF